jgi:hypothetical protein
MDEERIAEILAAAFEKLGMGEFGKNISNANKNLSEAQKKQQKQKELVDATAKKFVDLNEQLKKGRKQYIDLGEDLKRLNQNIDDVADPLKRQKLEIERNILAQKFLTDTNKKASEDFSKILGVTLVKGLFNATKTLVNSLQGGSSGVKLAADLMGTALDSTQSVFTGIAKTGETMGTAMMAAGGKTAKLGGRMAIASTALEFFTSAVTSAAKEGINLLATEAEKTIKAFNTATSAGALFGRGMDDLRLYARNAGLTVEQFSNVISNNSSDLARAGYTVEQGARIVGNVTSRFAVQIGKSGQTLQTEMLNLGLGFEEQANLTAQVVSDLKRTGGTATNGQVAQATANIAKNMKIVADIMGEEAKARTDAAKKQAEAYAFDVMLRKRAKETNNLELINTTYQALGMMSPAIREASIQATVLNGAIPSVAANLIDGGKSARTFAYNLMNGNGSLESLTQGTRELNDTFQNSNSELGRAVGRVTIATGDLADISQAYTDQQQDAFKITSDNFNKSLQDAETLSGAHGGLQGELMGVERQAQALKISIQDILTPSIINFGKVSNEVIASVRKAVSNVGSGGGTPKISESVTNVGLGVTALGALTALLGGAASLTGVGAAVGVPMIAAGTGMMTGGGAVTTAGALGSMMGFDDGGIAEGPKSGYPATLHGTEAVVPLSDNRSIPVSMDTGALTAAVHQQSGILTEILRTMRDTNSLTSGILQHSM